MAQHIQSGILQLIAQLGADHGAAGENGDILQHLFSSVAVAGSFYSHHVKGTTKLVDNQGGKGLALHILGDDQKLLAGLNDLLQKRQNLLDIGNLLISDQDAGVLQRGFHLIHIGSHVGRNIASVELHSFHQIQLGLHGLGLFNGNNTVSADLLHGIRHQLSYGIISGRDGCHSGDMLLAVYFLAHLGNSLYSAVGSLLHTLSQDNGVGACRQVLHTGVYHRLCQYGSCGGSVSCHVVGLGGYLFYKLCAHVLKSVSQLDLLCNGHTVIGDQGSPEGLIQHHISSFGSQCHSHGVSQLIDAGLQCRTGLCSVFDFFCHDDCLHSHSDLHYVFRFICFFSYCRSQPECHSALR